MIPLFSGKRPLFNRKYLVALVWILPIAVIFLNSDYLNAPLYRDLMRLDPQTLWFPSDSDSTEAALFLPYGQNLDGSESPEQRFLTQALNLRLAEPDVGALLTEYGLSAELTQTTTYLRLTLRTESAKTDWIQRLTELLAQPPRADWPALINRINAEQYLVQNQPRSKPFEALLPQTGMSLAVSLYEDALTAPLNWVIRSEHRPDWPEQRTQSLPSVSPETLGPAERTLSTRDSKGRDFLLWQLPRPATEAEYIAYQLAGLILSERLQSIPDTRWRVQLAPRLSLALLETPEDQGSDLWSTQLQALPNEAERTRANDEFQKRWNAFTTAHPLDWPGILLINGYDLESTRSGLDPNRVTLTQIRDRFWGVVQQPPLRIVKQRPISESPSN